jgi:hypothetical protein
MDASLKNFLVTDLIVAAGDLAAATRRMMVGPGPVEVQTARSACSIEDLMKVREELRRRNAEWVEEVAGKLEDVRRSVTMTLEALREVEAREAASPSRLTRDGASTARPG